MAAGNWPDAVGHDDDGEAEGDRDAEQIYGRWTGTHAADHGRPAAEEHKGESPDEFRKRILAEPLTAKPCTLWEFGLTIRLSDIWSIAASGAVDAAARLSDRTPASASLRASPPQRP